MHNAATIAGLGFINSLTTLAHAMGHSFGAAFHVHHGRSVSLFLPYTMEFAANRGNYRYADIARFIGVGRRVPEQVRLAPQPGGAQYGHIELGEPSLAELTRLLIQAIRDLEMRLESNRNVASLGISRSDYASAMEMMLDHAENDTSIVSSPRVPDRMELQKIYEYAYDGKPIDF